jgi:uncharacterized protein YqjF (DUF2071 family)
MTTKTAKRKTTRRKTPTTARNGRPAGVKVVKYKVFKYQVDGDDAIVKLRAIDIKMLADKLVTKCGMTPDEHGFLHATPEFGKSLARELSLVAHT